MSFLAALSEVVVHVTHYRIRIYQLSDCAAS